MKDELPIRETFGLHVPGLPTKKALFRCFHAQAESGCEICCNTNNNHLQACQDRMHEGERFKEKGIPEDCLTSMESQTLTFSKNK